MGGKLSHFIGEKRFSVNGCAFKNEERGTWGDHHRDAEGLPIRSLVGDDLATNQAGIEVVPFTPEMRCICDVSLESSRLDIPMVTRSR